MRLRRGLRTSINSLLAHRTRSLLALSSVSIGVAAVVLAGAIGKGAEAEVLRSLESLGTNLLVVRPAQVKMSVARRQVRGLARSLVPADAAALAQLAVVAEVVPGISAPLTVKSGAGRMSATVVGSTPDFPAVRRFRMQAGRFFDAGEEQSAARVAVLGSRVAETLFSGEDPIGRVLRIRGVPFDVIGAFASKGVMADGSDEDRQVVIPLRTALRRVFNVTWLDSVFVTVRAPCALESAADEIAGLLRARHRRADDCAVQDRTRFLAGQRELAAFLERLTIGLGAVAMLVGGTGILALMLLAVKERTREIGLRMALGATPRDVLAQFLVEATALALGGWAAGLAVGGLGAALVAGATGWRVALPLEAASASGVMAAAIGLGFGAVPARQAARVPPIQALSG